MERTRIVRSRSRANVGVALESLKAQVAEYARLQTSAIEAAVKLKEFGESLQSAMEAAKVTEVQSGAWIAALAKSAGRTSNTIDPRGFRNLVKDDKEFYSAIAVNATQAKAVLPAKALARITTSVEGSPGPVTLKVTQAKK